MKANRLSGEYENEVVQFLEFIERNILDNKGIFYCPCKICGIRKNMEMKKHSIIYVVMEFVKIIQHECGMVM